MRERNFHSIVNFLSDDEVRRVISEGVTAIVIKYGGAVASVIMLAALARAMGPSNFGYFGFALSLGSILAVVGSFGWQQVVVRYGTAYIADQDDARLVGLIRAGYYIVFGGCGLLGLCVILYAYLWPTVEARSHIAAAGAFAVGLGVAELTVSVLRIQGKLCAAMIPKDIVWRGIVSAIAFASLTGFIPSLTGSSGLWMAAIVLMGVVVIQLFMSRRTRPKALCSDPAKWEWNEWKNPALLLWGTSIVNKSGMPLAVVTMSFVLSPAELGGFFLATRLADATTLSVRSLGVVVAPQLGRLSHLDDHAALQKVVTMSALMTSFVAIGSALIYVVAGDWILSLFGNDFADAESVLVLLSLGLVVTALLGPGKQLMTMQDQEKYALRYSLLSNLGGFIAIIVLGLLIGPIGAAAGLAGSKIVNFSLRAWHIWRHVNIILFLPFQLLRVLLNRQ